MRQTLLPDVVPGRQAGCSLCGSHVSCSLQYISNNCTVQMCALNAKGEEEGAAGAPFSSLIHRRRAHHLSGHSHLPLNLRLEVPPLKNCRKEKTRMLSLEESCREDKERERERAIGRKLKIGFCEERDVRDARGKTKKKKGTSKNIQ